MTGRSVPTHAAHSPLVAFYSDDFTGAADAMEALELGGVPTSVFLRPPTGEWLAQNPQVTAVGVAGHGRTMTPTEMTQALPPVFASLANLAPSLLHYKVCSTFDSSPRLGSIGHACELAVCEMGGTLIPVVVANPQLGRYCAFGNLFAQHGVGGPVLRLDRHPGLRDHVVTPMREADISRHLGQQTSLNTHSIDLTSIQLGDLPTIGSPEPCMVVLDTVTADDLDTVGRWVWEWAQEGRSRVAVGSSGLSHALAAAWRVTGRTSAPPPCSPAGTVDRLLVVAGSRSDVTARQVEHALADGFARISIDAATPDAWSIATERASEALAAGHSPVLYVDASPVTHGGPADNDARTEILSGLAEVTLAVLQTTPVQRLLVCGGDTSAAIGSALDFEELRFLTSIDPAAPLCQCIGGAPWVDGLEVAFKGGQMGDVDYITRVREGRPAVPSHDRWTALRRRYGSPE